MPMQKTLVLIKPDALERGLAGRIISRFEDKGLQIVGLKMLQMDESIAKRHYSAHVSKPFYKGLAQFMCSRPIIAIAVEGVEAVEVVRTLVGATNGRKAAPGTIRGDLCNSFSSNVIHASDSEQSAEKELGIFFGKSELFGVKPINSKILYSSDEV